MRRAALAAVWVVLVVELGAMPVRADSTAVCTAAWVVAISPGVTDRPGRFTITSNGQGGVLVCSGLVAGKTVTGPGTIGELGNAEGTCTSGTGESDYSFALPTSAGPVTINVRANFVYGPGAGARLGDQIPGPFEFVATKGDCISSPVTEVRVTNQVLFRAD